MYLFIYCRSFGKFVEPLIRVKVMIVMATLQEADRMGNKNKILIQQQQLELLQSFVTNEKQVVKQVCQ
jgi:hypothetical protein